MLTQQDISYILRKLYWSGLICNFFFFCIIVFSTQVRTDQQLAKQENLSLYNEIYQFRNYGLSNNSIPEHDLTTNVMQFFSASYSSSIEIFSYWKQHLENLRSIAKFYRTHQVHIIGRSPLNEWIEIRLGVSEKEHEDVGFESDLHRTHPVVEIRFKIENTKEIYSSNVLEKALLKLRKACLRIDECQGVYIRAAQGITPYYHDITRYNPTSLSIPSEQQLHQLLLSVEWHDRNGDVLDAISYAHGLGSMKNYVWLEKLYKNHEIGTKGGGIFTLFSPEVIENSAAMISHAATCIERDLWHRPCARGKSQGFMSLYHPQCLRYEKKLHPLIDVHSTLDRKDSAISFTLAKNTFLVFDYYGRWFNYPAILLIVR